MNTWKNTKWKYSQADKWVHNKAHHYMSCSQQTTPDLGFKYSIKAEQSLTVDVYQEDCCKFRSDLCLLFFTPLSLSHPSHESHRCWLWWLGNEFSMNEGYSLNLNPSAWQKTAMLSAFFCLYLFTACPSSDITILLNHVCSLLFLFCLSQHCFSSRAHDDKNSFEFWRSLYIF